MYYIYKITFLKTGKFYIGQTCNLNKRKKRHLEELRLNKHHSIYFQRAYNKYGGTNSDFLFEVLFESKNKKEIDKEEERLILETYHVNYNVSKKASGGDLTSYHPNYEKIVQKHKEYKFPEERKIEYAKKFRGKNNPNYGKNHKGNPNFKWTDERKKKMSELNKGKILSEETKLKISESKKGTQSHNSKKVLCYGIEYPSASKAGLALNCSHKTILKYCRDKDNHDFLLL
ncbi:NUMOD3 domain-containing DNA-binding protein [Enterococcus faecium]|uniref:NUMOD3 domain-containing DNA-binding protein n=1 Tax=Enterococcus faecium TaxID=1352 RepID=UPI00093CE9D7|nr:NUMOD3 domain-containing DNA-binding protein [Enterococcus faecium]PHL10690.1 hypothetical protein CQR41_04870 [Enterococcus faecium]